MFGEVSELAEGARLEIVYWQPQSRVRIPPSPPLIVNKNNDLSVVDSYSIHTVIP